MDINKISSRPGNSILTFQIMYEIIKFMTLPEIITKMMALSREMNNFIK